ncbi:MAG TPA: type II toxin-antitoxin system PemK/MazF family toxin [Bacteroidia bacterium]|nr:type II toxin-antitoxin system PemK/MazF family toxin [Bacteroidia bacterium]
MKRGEIWLLNLDPTLGAEIKKTRPAVIVNHDHLGKLPLKIIVPLTDWKERYAIAPWMIKIIPAPQNGLSKNSAADCFQVRSVSETRFVKRLGKIRQEQLDEISQALSLVLQIRS